MIEIKFRAKTYKDKFYSDLAPSKWVYGFITQFPKDFTWMHISSDKQVMVMPDTVGQFTGLHDKDGNEIYEGDIVKNKEVDGYGLEHTGVVRYYEKDCRFGIDTTTTNKFTKRLLFTDGECSFNDGHCTIKYYNEYEVLGNIFDNPELLKSL